MQALLRQYTDEISDLKYRNKCLELEIDAMNLEFKELQTRMNSELDKRDQIIREQEEDIERMAYTNQAQIKRLVRERGEVQRMQGSTEQEIQQLQNENKRFVAEVVDQLAQALNVNRSRQLPHLLARTKQLRMEHDQLIVQHKKAIATLEEKDVILRQQATTRTKLEDKNKELDDQLVLLRDSNEHSQSVQAVRIAKLKEEIARAEQQTQTIRLSGQALHMECERLRGQLEEQRVRYVSDMGNQTAKLLEVEKQASEMRQQLEGLRTGSRATQIEEEFAGLLDKIRVRKQTKIKNMLSEKYRRFEVNGRAGTGSNGGGGQRDTSSMFEY